MSDRILWMKELWEWRQRSGSTTTIWWAGFCILRRIIVFLLSPWETHFTFSSCSDYIYTCRIQFILVSLPSRIAIAQRDLKSWSDCFKISVKRLKSYYIRTDSIWLSQVIASAQHCLERFPKLFVLKAVQDGVNSGICQCQQHENFSHKISKWHRIWYGFHQVGF